jgi:hypothetical protein
VLADPAIDWNGDGAVDAKNDEWIEIRNIDTVPIDLSQYWLRDSSGDTPDLRLSGVADPDEHIVLFGSDSVAWQAANGLSQTGFALNNTGDLVQLLRTIPGTDPVQYELMFAVSIYDHGAEDDRSCGFDTAHVEWLLFDVLNPYPGVVEPVGSGCAPSPGAPERVRPGSAHRGRQLRRRQGDLPLTPFRRCEVARRPGNGVPGRRLSAGGALGPEPAKTH